MPGGGRFRHSKESSPLNKRIVILEKMKEACASVLPIITIVAVLCLIWVPMETDLMLAFVIGALFLILGMGLFTVGSELSMTQIGSHIGAQLTRSRNLTLILSVSFLLGIAITVAEPDLQVLAGSVPGIQSSVLIIVVSVGVGLFLMLSMVRILNAIPLRWMILAFYGLVFLLAVFTDKNFLSVAFDSGGVTTGPMTVPFIMALGLGVASIRSDARAQEDSFGLVGLCSIGPILAVLILGFIYHTDISGSEVTAIPSYESTVALGRGYLEAIPHSLKEVGIALLPIAVFFLIFQFVFLHMHRVPFFRIVVGLLMTLAGLMLFLTGVNVGFSPLGYMLGHHLAETEWRFLLIPLGALMGWFIIRAEPAVHVLNKQVEELSAGAISAKAMGLSLSIAVAAAMGLSMVRAITGLSILWFIVPGYLISLLLSLVVSNTFTAIAFDSGGVASGPLTAAFMLPFAMGAVSSMGGNVMSDAFGLVALVAMMPLITVQIMGVISMIAARRRSVFHPAIVYGDADIIELWEM